MNTVVSGVVMLFDVCIALVMDGLRLPISTIINSTFCCFSTEALEYHSSSFLFPRVSFDSRELVLFTASYFWFPRVSFVYRELFFISASYFSFPRLIFYFRDLFFISAS